ncbi:hypothetical protein OAT84_01345 [Gammaproteobacteria bacterium]|nr:hypothetical protein [Gammaproteobacteria bacterium]
MNFKQYDKNNTATLALKASNSATKHFNAYTPNDRVTVKFASIFLGTLNLVSYAFYSALTSIYEFFTGKSLKPNFDDMINSLKIYLHNNYGEFVVSRKVEKTLTKEQIGVVLKQCKEILDENSQHDEDKMLKIAGAIAYRLTKEHSNMQKIKDIIRKQHEPTAFPGTIYHCLLSDKDIKDYQEKDAFNDRCNAIANITKTQIAFAKALTSESIKPKGQVESGQKSPVKSLGQEQVDHYFSSYAEAASPKR